MVFPLALTFLQNLAVVLFILVCLAIILIVLLQKGRGGGVGAAFGGGGGGGSLLGTKTGDFLTWVTICLVALFLVMAVLMGKFLRPGASSELAAPVMTAPLDAAPATDTPADGDMDAAADALPSASSVLPPAPPRSRTLWHGRYRRPGHGRTGQRGSS